MRVGIVGTGAIAWKHAQAYKSIGFELTACTDIAIERGRKFAESTGAELMGSVEELCANPRVDYVDLCTLPSYRLEAVELCAKYKKHIMVQKPMAVDLQTAEKMIEVARHAGIQLGVVSQHRFDDSILFLKKAIAEGRLGRIIQADAYVKWYRTPEYYAPPIKGTWAGEGGGALVSQAIHQVDLLLYLIGSVDEVFGFWKLGGLHKIEAEDTLSAVLNYSSGALGVIQATTSLWPGYPERVEIHGTKGTAIITGDQLTTWDVQGDSGENVPLAKQAASGASDPMAISVAPFERQLKNFGESCMAGKAPVCSGLEGYRALQLVRSIYDSCTEGKKVRIAAKTL